MYRKIWKECHSSVCSIHFLSKTGTRIITFTGFRIRDYLITDDIIDKFTQPAKVYLRFTKEDGHTEKAGKTMTYAAFKDRIFHPGGKVVPGYVIIRLEDKEFHSIPSLKCSRKVDYEIGHPIAVLGYQLDQDNLAIKKGILSSYFTNQDGLNYMQVDASIKQGNAGSPLIETENMEVIGVIGHHLASIARSYFRMMKIFNKNLEILKEVQGKYNFDGIDPVQVLIANQNQIKHIATEYFKSANMRVGFAVELCNLIDYCPDRDTAMDLEVKQEG
jgi:hypothetical protein